MVLTACYGTLDALVRILVHFHYLHKILGSENILRKKPFNIRFENYENLTILKNFLII